MSKNSSESRLVLVGIIIGVVVLFGFLAREGKLDDFGRFIEGLFS